MQREMAAQSAMNRRGLFILGLVYLPVNWKKGERFKLDLDWEKKHKEGVAEIWK